MNLPLKFTFADDYSKYLNPSRFYSYQGIATYILIGGRGIGKTTAFIKNAIRDYMKNGNEFVYCRRYKTEIKKAREILQPIVTGTKTRNIGEGIFEYTHNKVRIGYGLCLSLQQSYKSGIDFTKVHTLIYDEAILERGATLRYLDNEMTFLFELISTIFRTRTDYRIFILGNNADLFNPYFEYFKVPKFKERYIDLDRGLYCELLPIKEDLLRAEEKTPLYKLTNKTAYGEYHYNNAVLSDVEGTIGDKPYDSKFICRVVFNNYTLNFYIANSDVLYVEFRDKSIKDEYAYILWENSRPNFYYSKKYHNSDIRTLINKCYFDGIVIYNDQRGISLMNLFMDSFAR